MKKSFPYPLRTPLHWLLGSSLAWVLLASGCGNPTPPPANPPDTLSTMANIYDQYPTYDGNDLGITFEETGVVFKVWAPTASQVVVRIYAEGSGGDAVEELDMSQILGGVWVAIAPKPLKGLYYTFQTQHGDNWLNEVPDPYAVAVGVNGRRSMVLDLSETTPKGWMHDKGIRPYPFTDIILYEMHVRDFTVDPNVVNPYPGKFLGVAQTGTKYKGTIATGLDHLKELGITHVHLLPSFDHQSIDESRLDTAQYNWGYDPLNYNVPEGSYSTHPEDGANRVQEFRQMVKTLHDHGIGVVLDVVYNHTGSTEESIFNQIEPGYYYRHNEDGSFSNASGCGNETASERTMMRNYIVQSVVHWAKNYHIDGFRFDLMGIHDLETMQAVRSALDEVDPHIFIYGEGWTAGGSPLPEDERAVKRNTHLLPGIAAFCDEMRDGIKGHWSDKMDRGFATGKPGMTESIQFGLAGAIQHPGIDYSKVNYSQAPWAKEPSQCINYVECHDDLCLRDKIEVSAPDLTLKPQASRLALAMVLTSQGVPFLHSGAEIYRTKQHDHNSYKSGDDINHIRWDWKGSGEGKTQFDYIKSMIRLRKEHPAFRMGTADLVREHLQFLPQHDSLLVAYRLNGAAVGDTWKDILVVANGHDYPMAFALPEGKWKVGANENGYIPHSTESHSGKTSLPAKTLIVVYQP